MKLRTRVIGISIALLGVTLGATAPVAAASAPLTHAVNHRGARSAAWPGPTSGNWSGYGGVVSAGNKLTYASSSWIVPSVAAKTGYSSSWVGIDGFTNSNLIQTGTEQDYVKGKPIYRAWWEILPAPETIIPSLTITPGDVMSAFVKNTKGNKWTISITDVTTGHSFSIKQTYTGPGTSAEWIQEAPTNGGILPLAHYSQTEFFKIQLGLNFGAAQNLVLAYPGEAIAMVQNGKQISTPSKPTGNSFNVAYGKKQPAPPV